MYSLGIDVGGTGCKCVAFREDGAQTALAYEEYPLQSGQLNLPSEMLTQSVFRVIRRCTEQMGEAAGEIKCLSVSSFGESFVALDKDGKALTDILLYFGNTQSVAFEQLVQQVGTDRFMQIARILPDASYSLSKMLYTKAVADRPVWKFLFIAGFLCYRLSGEAYTDVSLACRSLLYDVRRNCWSEELLEACGIAPESLPQVVEAGTAIGKILPGIAGQLGLPEDTEIVIGAHDQIVNALGAGVRNPSEAVDTSGTCECITPLFSHIPENMDFLAHNFACVPYLRGNGYVTYAYNISAGSVVRWYRDALGHYLQQQAEKENKSIYDLLNETCPAEPTQLMVLPFLQGMGGTPEVDPNATGLIAGLTTQTRLPDIYRAILEGITFEMRYNQEKLAAAGVELGRLYACGGGAKSPVWLQIKADILGCEIIPVKREETGAMGSAILALAAIREEDPFEVAKRFWSYAEPVVPNADHREVYDRRYEMYKSMRNWGRPV